MNKDERARNMFTGLGAVMFILIGIIILPLVIPLVTAVTSIGLTVLLAAFVIYLVIMMFTAIGSMINSARDGKTTEFTTARMYDGHTAVNKGMGWVNDLAAKFKNRGAATIKQGYIWCPACKGNRKIDDVICSECNGAGFIKDEPEPAPEEEKPSDTIHL